MPINNITQTISTLPPAGKRGVDVQTQFVIKQEDFQDHLQGTTVTELNTLKDQLNSRIGEINSTTTTMNGYASTASAGASTATTKAGEASTSASDALSYKNQAETFKNNAAASATKASQWSDNNYNVEVETGRYSAKHWSTVAQNTLGTKVDKVTSTDNAIVRFDGTTGEVQNSGVVIDDAGNVGINNPTPNRLLTINNRYFYGQSETNGQAQIGDLIFDGSSSQRILSNAGYYGSGLFTPSKTSSAGIIFDTNAIRFTVNSGLTVGSNFIPTTRMTLDADGNVGVGTSSPTFKIDITNASGGNMVNASYTGGVKTPYIRLRVNSDTLSELSAGNSDNTCALGLKVNGTERMRIDSNGNFISYGSSNTAATFPAAATNGSKIIHRYMGTIADSKTGVLILAEQYSATFLNKQGFIGKVYVNRGDAGAGNITESADVTITSAYNSSNLAITNNTSSGEVMKIMEVVYNSKKYYGVYFSSATSARSVYISGQVLEDTFVPVLITDAASIISAEVVSNMAYRSIAGSHLFGRTSSQDMILDASGNLLLTSGTGALGYGTGAGGTVTQLTSKSTAVTLNKPTGQITMNNAALAAGAYIDFSINNSIIGGSDIVILSGDTYSGNYRIEVRYVFSGICVIRITNITAGSLSEALVFKFAIIKGAIA